MSSVDEERLSAPLKILKSEFNPHSSVFSTKNRFKRLLWNIIWTLFARPLPRSLGRYWKILLLRTFGAKVHDSAMVYSNARIYMPWNLRMHEYSCLGPEVDCYNVAKVTLGSYTTISQKSYLCTASHDIMKMDHPLITGPITIMEKAWVGAEAFIGLGVTIQEGAVVGARSAVFKDVPEWTVVGGNPAKFIKKRVITDD